MPLRDHFRPPATKKFSWAALHGGWPMVIVQQLKKQLPPGFSSAPTVHIGSQIEIDIGTFELDERTYFTEQESEGGVATARKTWTQVAPNVDIETDIPDEDCFEVRIYNADEERTLVAVIELVSPANKDRDDSRNAFVGKCASLLRQGVSVSIVDLVTNRQANLYAELMSFIGKRDLTLPNPPPAIYATTCRWRSGFRRGKLETWTHALAIDQPLPTIPIWLTRSLAIPLELEASYEKTCDDLSP